MRFLITLAAILIAGAMPLPAFAQVDPVHLLENAEFVMNDARTPPPDDAPWRPVTLPDDWHLTHPGPPSTGWYRLTYDIPPGPPVTYSIFLPRNSARKIDIFINGKPHASTIAYGDPGSRILAPPVIFTLPPPLIRPGRNVMHIRVEAVPEIRHGLTRIVVAPGQAVRRLYEGRLAIQVTTLFMFGAAALICGLLALAFWFRERRDTTLLWFAITTFGWAMAAIPWTHGIIAPPAFSHGPLAFATRFAYAAPMLVLCLRIAGKRWLWPEVGLWLFTLLGLVLVSAIDEAHQGSIITYWSVTYLAALTMLLLVLVRSQHREHTWASWMFAAAVILVAALNLHDLARWMGWIDYDSLTLSHFHIPLVLLAIGTAIVDRHFQAVAAVIKAKAGLEARVAEKTREIEANYARVQEAEREKTLAHERRRIMADMHDGLGSGLVGLLGMVQSGKTTLPEIERRLHDSLQELRLAVDALEPVDGDLGVVLGNVRHRMRAAIENSGVRLNWQVAELPQLSYLTPKAILAIQRIALEALTNALRHARARHITVSTKFDSNWLEIGIADDGIGYDDVSVTRGRGLDSMRSRAYSFGGLVEVCSTPGTGTRVTLRLPANGSSAG